MTVPPSSVVESIAVREVAEQLLAGYWSARTRANYAIILNGWISWCATHRHDPTSDVDPRVLEAWIRHSGSMLNSGSGSMPCITLTQT